MEHINFQDFTSAIDDQYWFHCLLQYEFVSPNNRVFLRHFFPTTFVATTDDYVAITFRLNPVTNRET